MTEKGKIKGKKSPTKLKKEKKVTLQKQVEFEDLKDEITAIEGAPQNFVYSEDAVGEENVRVSDSLENYIPENSNAKRLLLSENSSGASLRPAVSDVEPPLLQQTSSFSLQEGSSSGVSPAQDPYHGQLTPLAQTFVPRNFYPNTFSSDPNPSLGTLHGSVNSEISLRYQTSVSREEDSALQSKPSTAEAEWSKRLHALEEEELAERAALDKRMREARKKLETEMNCAIQEREIMYKKQEIKRQQEELQCLEERLSRSERGCRENETLRDPLPSMHQSRISDQPPISSSVQRISNPFVNQENTMDGVVSGRLPRRECTASKQTESRSQQSCLPSVHHNEASSQSADLSSALQLHSLLERQQNTMDEVVRGLRMPQREYTSLSGEPHTFPLR